MLVKNIPPVPEGFDPDSVTFGVPPTTGTICMLVTGSGDGKWERYTNYSWGFKHIHCLPIKPWYPDCWYDSEGNLLPDVYEYDFKLNKWPEHAGPLDKVDGLSNYQRIHKKGPYTGLSPSEVLSWFLVAYRVVKRHTP